jgi:hypothetical protein
VLELELVEERVLELMRTGLPIRAHMALLDELAADRLVTVFVERPCRRSDASCTLTACAPCSGQAEPSRQKAAGRSSSVSFGSIAEYRPDDTNNRHVDRSDNVDGGDLPGLPREPEPPA